MKYCAIVLATLAFSATAPSAVAQSAEWTPLTDDFFGELTAPWIPVPNGDSGAPRQGWLATADGFFTREAHLAYSYTDATLETHEVLARFNYPLSRRFWVGAELPFYRDVGGNDDVGDATITTQVMLLESRNLSVNAGVGWRIPIGSESIGGGVFAAEPQLNLWTDIGSGFSMRGRVSYSFPDSGVDESFALNFAIGQTFTDHAKAPLGDLTWYISGNWRESLSGPGSFVSVTPGVRTHLGGNLFALAGIEIPVTNPDNSFRERFIFQLVQGF